jgi:streptogramin lyase
VPLASITGPAIGEEHATVSLPLPSRAQGAAFDPAGRLWVTRSGATLGEVLRLDPRSGAIQARYPLPDGVEDLSFDAAGKLWTVSEAGSRRWGGWATFFPVVFQLDPARLR